MSQEKAANRNYSDVAFPVYGISKEHVRPSLLDGLV
jgi:hypothetical protein